MHKLDKINEELRREIGSIIQNDLTNSNITGMISVTGVKITPDLRFAKVYISIFQSKNKKDVLVGLKNATGYIKKILGSKINLRHTPDLTFEVDDTLEYAAHINEVIKKM